MTNMLWIKFRDEITWQNTVYPLARDKEYDIGPVGRGKERAYADSPKPPPVKVKISPNQTIVVYLNLHAKL